MAYLDTALVAARLIFGPANPTVSKILIEQYDVFSEWYGFEYRHNPDKATQIAVKGRAYADSITFILKANKQPELAYFNHLRGMAAVSENDFEKGEEFYLKSLKYALPDYKGKSLNQVPEINQVFAENHLGVILEALTYYYIAKYRQADDVHFLET